MYLFPDTFDLYEKIPAVINGLNGPAILMDTIEFSVHMVIDRWEEVADYFGRLIGHRERLADPEAHDSLLFDDDSFSRSRRYFWAINYLAELDISIGENIVQLERCVATWPQYTDFAFHEERQTEKRSLNERLNQLKDLRDRLRALRQDAIALRDGLFSASGVIESRAATRLGENIRLLTFVSIFFLPLSFCTVSSPVSNSLCIFSHPAVHLEYQ